MLYQISFGFFLSPEEEKWLQSRTPNKDLTHKELQDILADVAQSALRDDLNRSMEDDTET
jgi:hypothetical protein